MEPKGNLALVGLFVVVLALAIVGSVLWLSGAGHGGTTTYTVYMKESVSGLTADAPVKYRGVDVGHVERIGLRADDPTEVELTLAIDPKTPVREDTRAMLEYQGLTGLAFLNLVGGSKDSPPLRAKSGQPHPVIESTPSLYARLDVGVSNLLTSLTATSDELKTTLGGKDGAALARTIENLERVSQVLAARSGTLDSTASAAAHLFSNASKASDNLPELVAKIDSVATQWNAASVELRGLATDGRAEVSRAANEVTGDTQTLSADLQRLMARLDRVVEELERDPSVVVHGRPKGRKGPGE